MSADMNDISSREAELERELSRGARDRLPPNQPKGILGEVMPDITRPQEFGADDNAGISQETDFPVVLMGLLLAYLLFFPLAFVILWRSSAFSARGRIAGSMLMALGVLVVAFGLATGWIEPVR